MADCIGERLYVSTVASDALETAEEFGLGLEIADFCTASNLDGDSPYSERGLRLMGLGRRMSFHFPFAELYPCAIDPLARELALRRHNQALRLALRHGIGLMVAHAAFVPEVYCRDWFIERSAEYWREFLENVPRGAVICLENVLEPEPEYLAELCDAVADERLRVCLDVGHAHRFSTVPTERWIDILGQRIAHVHLHNNDGLADRHWELPRGEMDMAGIIERAAASAPEASFALECMMARSSAAWLFERGVLT